MYNVLEVRLDDLRSSNNTFEGAEHNACAASERRQAAADAHVASHAPVAAELHEVVEEVRDHVLGLRPVDQAGPDSR